LGTKRKDYIDYSISANFLYRKIIFPVADLMKGKDVTIVPDDELSYIPFDALLTEMPDTSRMNFNNLKYLIKLYPINYSYSATLLYDFSEVLKNEAKNILAFSPAYHEEIGRKANDNSNVYHFIPLENTEDEIEKISNHLKTVHYTGLNASKANFLSQASNFEILHLAMHTIINDSLPMFSKLVFSDPKIGSDDDGFLNTYEIYNMKLNSRMVVLSACETGSGKLQKGEGIMSMARGFLYAGCPSIIMTMWQVDDQSGSNLMADFYNYLSKGKRKDVALRLAKLKHLENADPAQSHPHYWLGYVSVGSSDPLFSGKKIYLIVFLILIVIGLIGDWYLRKRFKSNIVK
jgi:CHAT domain-containing protein